MNKFEEEAFKRYPTENKRVGSATFDGNFYKRKLFIEGCEFAKELSDREPLSDEFRKKVLDFARKVFTLQRHPLTCNSSGKNCERRLNTGEGILTETENGYVCPCGEYVQPLIRP